MEKVRKDEVPFERSLSVGGYIYIYRAPRCTYAFSLEAATPSVDFLALTFDSKKEKKTSLGFLANFFLRMFRRFRDLEMKEREICIDTFPARL